MKITKTLGRYPYRGYHKKSWLVKLDDLPEGCPLKSILEYWEENDEPKIEHLMPSDVILLFKERMKSYEYLDTGRIEKKEAIQWLQDHSSEIDLEVKIDWLQSYITTQMNHYHIIKYKIANLNKELETLKNKNK